MRYQCPNPDCGRVYKELTQDGLCKEVECLGLELVPYTGESAKKVSKKASNSVPQQDVNVIGGLCVLVCDGSFSMDEQAFSDRDETKLKMVTRAVYQAVSELSLISMPDDAFICIISFGARASLVSDKRGQYFIPVSAIKPQFGDKLGEYLFEYLEEDKGSFDRRHTDFSVALQLARDIYDGAVAGDLSRFDKSKAVSLLDQTPVEKRGGGKVNVPNVRVMLYSDGEHNPQGSGTLSNPFNSLEVSPLMTAFIGDESINEKRLRGANQLKELANICPAHGKKGYFLINSPERHAVLRNLFRMATNHSGFCPECLKGVMRAEEEGSHHG